VNRNIINLRRERKRRKSIADKEEAQFNRVKFGQTRTQKEKEESDKHKSYKFLYGHKLEENTPSKNIDYED
tara:strand:- start:278 stop:490 length:213 start_codon:yes stop_codon:yes gene_type:complete